MAERINKGLSQSSVGQSQSFRERLTNLGERVGDATPAELMAIAIERYALMNPKQVMNYQSILQLVSRDLMTLGFNPYRQEPASFLPYKYSLPIEAAELRHSGLTYNLDKRTARTAYAEMFKPLPPSQHTVMKLLIASPEEVITYDVILNCLGINYIGIGINKSDLLRPHVSHLRRALGDLFKKGGHGYPILVTVRSTGYVLTNGTGAPNTHLPGTL